MFSQQSKQISDHVLPKTRKISLQDNIFWFKTHHHINNKLNKNIKYLNQ